ncbi:bifunctional DNA primase/polymerase [Brucellaceae bacterium D45D]
MGVFADWQPEYAARGVATFPVRDKRPAVKGYLKIGIRTSEQFAMRFDNDDAFGLACKRSKIVVLDCDTPDERVFADALDRHGKSPFIVRSGSGNWQAWYRHDGETRRVRPNPKLPIDILGDGFVVAPPSMGAKGQYQLVEGSLDDLENLPTLRGVKSYPNKKHNTLSPFSSPHFSEDGTEKKEGKRNQQLWEDCMKMARGCRRLEELMDRAMQRNREFYQPLETLEVMRIVASAWGYETENKNWFGHGARVVVDHSIVDKFAANEPDAFALFSILMRNHWGRDFVLAKAFAISLGWTLKRFKRARDVLREANLIECIHPGGGGPNDPPVYRFPEAPEVKHEPS